MKRSKRLQAVISAMALCLVVGCSAVEGQDGHTEKGEKEKITVVVPRQELDTVGLVEEYVREFEEKNGIEVELINAAWDVCTDKIRTELSVGGSSYDVVDFDNSLVAMYIENDWLEPLDQYDGAEEMKKTMVEGLVDKFTVDDSFYGVVWNNDTHVYLYNEKMLNDAGIAEPPKTWEELIAVSRTLIDKGICKYGMPMCFSGNGAVNEVTCAIYSFGGNVFQNGKLCIGSDEGALEALKTLASMLDEGLIDPASLSYDYEAAANVFLNGDSAFFIQAMPGLYTTANDPEQSQVAGEIKAAPYTITNSKDTNVVLTVPEAYAIPKNSQHKEAAWEFIKYMASVEFDKVKAVELGALPVYEAVFEEEEVLNAHPEFAEMSTQVEYARGLDDFTWYDEYSNIFQSELQSLLLGNITAEQCVENIQKQCAQYEE
ncbi:sugar ABC transporter substrate-binding protein [Lachnospiraceae bacterium]|nr:sugar ABC transporter substrate-binding protein [Lachnospiraceae bacterium]